MIYNDFENHTIKNLTNQCHNTSNLPVSVIYYNFNFNIERSKIF